MKVGDLVKHYRSNRLGLVVRENFFDGFRMDPRPFIEVVWLSDGLDKPAHDRKRGQGSTSLFIMVSES